jgi:hypothetical protein
VTEVPVGPKGRPFNMGVKKSHARLTDGRLLQIPDDFDHKEHKRRQIQGHRPHVMRAPNGPYKDLIGDF